MKEKKVGPKLNHGSWEIIHAMRHAFHLVQVNCGSTSNKLQQNLFYRAIDKVDELNNILKVPKNSIGGTC